MSDPRQPILNEAGRIAWDSAYRRAERTDKRGERVQLLEEALREIIHAAAYSPPHVLWQTIAKHRHLVGMEPT